MKKVNIYAILLTLILSACGVRPTVVNAAATPTATVSIPTATVTPAPTQIPTQAPSPTPLPDIGKSYTGYWLKLSKEIGPSGSQTMTLYYQNGYELTVIATFCVRAGDNNTPNGFYFIAIDRPTTYPTAHGGYATTFFSHNFAWKISNRNWYLHAAPWNTQGIDGCPTNGSGGCVNMRTDDFNIILNGGEYKNPITGETTTVPDLGVGTPFVIADTENACTYLGQCMTTNKCVSGKDCFHQYTCEFCIDWGTRWDILTGKDSALKVLDLPTS